MIQFAEVFPDEKIVVSLKRKLEIDNGEGFSEKILRHMLRFAEAFPDEQIVSAPMRQCRRIPYPCRPRKCCRRNSIRRLPWPGSVWVACWGMKIAHDKTSRSNRDIMISFHKSFESLSETNAGYWELEARIAENIVKLPDGESWQKPCPDLI